MSDLLLSLGRSARTQTMVRRLGIPIPLPVPLRRASGPWASRPIADARVAIGASAAATSLEAIAAAIAGAGGICYLGPGAAPSAFAPACEAFGQPARSLEALEDGSRVDTLVYDATGLDDWSALRALYDFARPLVGRLATSGRFVVVARNDDPSTPRAAAAQAALGGFARSAAKELGRIGATVNVARVAHGAEPHVVPALRFLVSPNSAFVTGQELVLTGRAGALHEAPFVRPLEHKIALVTGAARGIGAATVRALAIEGARVVCVDRPEVLGQTSQLAREVGGSALGVDLTSGQAPPMVAAALRAAGGIDVVVHNAGITRDKTLARMSPEQWDAVLAVNLGAALCLGEEIEPLLRDRGRIVCVSSVAGIAGNVGQTAYAAAKSGLLGFVRAGAERLAPRGVTVNAVAPGLIETRMTAAMPLAIREVARRMSALRQGGQPEDVAQAILFLASPGAQGITGDTLRVCGGSYFGA